MNKRKKLIIVLPGFGFGGTVFSTLNMLSYIRDRYDVSIFGMRPYGPIRYQYSNYDIIEPSSLLKAVVASPLGEESNLLNKIKLIIAKFINHLLLQLNINIKYYVYKKEACRISRKYDIDIVASAQECEATRFVSFFENVRRIAWFRSEYSIMKRDLLSPENVAKDHKFYSRFEKIICVSQTTCNDFQKNFPELKDRVLAVHNIQNFQHIIDLSKEPINDRFDKDTFNIVTVGRVAKQKQIYKIPSIAYEIKERYGLNFKWYIIGDGNVGGERDRLNDAFEKYNNRDYVIELGSRKNPYPYIASADLLVNTSYYEACPRVVAEAKILHIPVVCADFSSAREFVKSGYDGFVEKDDKLASVIAKFISDIKFYSQIKMNCNRYSMNNEEILMKLYSIFG